VQPVTDAAADHLVAAHVRLAVLPCDERRYGVDEPLDERRRGIDPVPAVYEQAERGGGADGAVEGEQPFVGRAGIVGRQRQNAVRPDSGGVASLFLRDGEAPAHARDHGRLVAELGHRSFDYLAMLGDGEGKQLAGPTRRHDRAHAHLLEATQAPAQPLHIQRQIRAKRRHGESDHAAEAGAQLLGIQRGHGKGLLSRIVFRSGGRRPG
jgi:hypothetical protein